MIASDAAKMVCAVHESIGAQSEDAPRNNDAEMTRTAAFFRALPVLLLLLLTVSMALGRFA